jgi:hypothetical protein
MSKPMSLLPRRGRGIDLRARSSPSPPSRSSTDRHRDHEGSEILPRQRPDERLQDHPAGEFTARRRTTRRLSSVIPVTAWSTSCRPVRRRPHGRDLDSRTRRRREEAPG